MLTIIRHCCKQKKMFVLCVEERERGRVTRTWSRGFCGAQAVKSWRFVAGAFGSLDAEQSAKTCRQLTRLVFVSTITTVHSMPASRNVARCCTAALGLFVDWKSMPLSSKAVSTVSSTLQSSTKPMNQFRVESRPSRHFCGRLPQPSKRAPPCSHRLQALQLCMVPSEVKRRLKQTQS